jgi:NodT family efflux transporter outer membrane factor (OMF) lipoprotein
MGAERLQESGQAFLLPEKVPVANIGDIGISASYQFDLFGTLQRGIEAAKANADATQAAADTARITLVADVVRAYTQVCAANEEREIAQHSLDLQSQSTTLIQRLRDAGRGDETQVTRSQTQFKSLRADMPRYEAARQAGLFRLSMLLAKPVDQLPAGTATCAELPKIAQLVPVGDGAALLKRRPDVRQAERRLAAATAGIGIATGELYPNISIGATIGTVGILGDLGDPSTNRWGFGPSLSWTVPTNGARARIREAEATTQGALAHFDGVVLNAIRETQTALAQYSALLQRRDALADAEQSAKLAADQTHRFFQAGRESFLADLQATRTYTDVTAQLAGEHAGCHEPDRFVPRPGRRVGKRTNASLEHRQTLRPLLCFEVLKGRWSQAPLLRKARAGHGETNNEKPLCSRLLVRRGSAGAAFGHLFLRRHAGPSDRQGLVFLDSATALIAVMAIAWWPGPRSRCSGSKRQLEQGKTLVLIWDTKVALRRVETVFDRYFWGSYWQPGRTFQKSWANSPARRWKKPRSPEKTVPGARQADCR